MFLSALVVAATVVSSPSITVEVTGHGRPMILIPGFVSSGGVWKSVVDHYKDRFECHVVTVAGFAGTAPVQPIGLRRLRDDVIEYAKAKKLERPVIVGPSMGGVLAMWIAATEPSLPSAVVSVDGVPFLPALMNPSATPDSTTAQAGQMKTLYESLTPAQLGAQSRMSLSGMITEKARVDEAAKWAEASDPKTAAALLFDLMTTDLRSEVGRITAPLLLIPAVKAAGDDAQRLQTMVEAYEKQIASVRTHKVVPARTLHFVMFDDPAFLTATLDAFLK